MPLVVLHKVQPAQKEMPKSGFRRLPLVEKILGMRSSFARRRLKPLLEEIKSAVDTGCSNEEWSSISSRFQKLSDYKKRVAAKALNIFENDVLSNAFLEIEGKNPNFVVAYLADEAVYYILRSGFAEANLSWTIQRSQGAVAKFERVDSLFPGRELSGNHRRRPIFHDIMNKASLIRERGPQSMEEIDTETRAHIAGMGYDLSGVRLD